MSVGAIQKGLLSGVAALSCLILTYGCAPSQPSVKAIDPSIRSSQVVKDGWLTVDQLQQTRAIANRTRKAGSISDADFKYILSEMEAVRKASSLPPYARMFLASPISEAKVISPSQRDDLIPVVKALLRSSDVRERSAGIRIANLLEDPQFVPDVLPLLKEDARMPQVKTAAEKYLARHKPY